MKTNVKEHPLTEVMDFTVIVEAKDLVVFNDDFNTFEHVIATLIRVCKHTPEQAEQCTWIIHHRGKCTVKTGTYEELQPLREAICLEGIDAKII